MGRYYNGDIEGKFWFAVQSSDAADRFGVIGHEPNYLNYYFESSDLPSVEAELDRIVEALGENKDILDKFFDTHNGYNDDMLFNYFYNNHQIELTRKDLQLMLSEYADYHLGVQIRDSIKETGQCYFEAEL